MFSPRYAGVAERKLSRGAPTPSGAEEERGIDGGDGSGMNEGGRAEGWWGRGGGALSTPIRT